MHTRNPDIWETEEIRLPGFTTSLGYTVRYHLKRQTNKQAKKFLFELGQSTGFGKWQTRWGPLGASVLEWEKEVREKNPHKHIAKIILGKGGRDGPKGKSTCHTSLTIQVWPLEPILKASWSSRHL